MPKTIKIDSRPGYYDNSKDKSVGMATWPLYHTELRGIHKVCTQLGGERV